MDTFGFCFTWKKKHVLLCVFVERAWTQSVNALHFSRSVTAFVCNTIFHCFYWCVVLGVAWWALLRHRRSQTWIQSGASQCACSPRLCGFSPALSCSPETFVRFRSFPPHHCPHWMYGCLCNFCSNQLSPQPPLHQISCHWLEKQKTILLNCDFDIYVPQLFYVPLNAFNFWRRLMAISSTVCLFQLSCSSFYFLFCKKNLICTPQASRISTETIHFQLCVSNLKLLLLCFPLRAKRLFFPLFVVGFWGWWLIVLHQGHHYPHGQLYLLCWWLWETVSDPHSSSER